MNEGLKELLNYRRKDKLTIVNIGLKIFGKNKGNQSSLVDFRILNEGLHVLLPLMNKNRIIDVSVGLYDAFCEKHDHMLTFQELAEIHKCTEFESKTIGSAVMRFGEGYEFAVTVWIGKNNVSLMISKEEITKLKSSMDA